MRSATERAACASEPAKQVDAVRIEERERCAEVLRLPPGPLGQTAVREERAMAYKNALVKKFQHMPQVKNIMKQRNLPKFIKKQGAMKQLQKEGSKRKEENIIKHSKAGSVERKGERDKVVVRQHE